MSEQRPWWEEYEGDCPRCGMWDLEKIGEVRSVSDPLGRAIEIAYECPVCDLAVKRPPEDDAISHSDISSDK